MVAERYALIASFAIKVNLCEPGIIFSKKDPKAVDLAFTRSTYISREPIKSELRRGL